MPRAEIALLIASRGNAAGEWFVSDELYGALVLVAAVTCLLTPPVLDRILARSPASLSAPGDRGA